MMAIAYIEIGLTKSKKALIDIDDYTDIICNKWCALYNGSKWYAVRSVRVPRKMQIYMHRFLTRYKIVDHKNGNGLDNRRTNLRSATPLNNQHNIRSVGGTSIFKGVRRKPLAKKWEAHIRVYGSLRHLGMFNDEILAAKAYDEAARRYFGEFAALNFPIGNEQSAHRSL